MTLQASSKEVRTVAAVRSYTAETIAGFLGWDQGAPSFIKDRPVRDGMQSDSIRLDSYSRRSWVILEVQKMGVNEWRHRKSSRTRRFQLRRLLWSCERLWPRYGCR